MGNFPADVSCAGLTFHIIRKRGAAGSPLFCIETEETAGSHWDSGVFFRGGAAFAPDLLHIRTDQQYDVYYGGRSHAEPV